MGTIAQRRIVHRRAYPPFTCYRNAELEARVIVAKRERLRTPLEAGEVRR